MFLETQAFSADQKLYRLPSQVNCLETFISVSFGKTSINEMFLLVRCLFTFQEHDYFLEFRARFFLEYIQLGAISST